MLTTTPLLLKQEFAESFGDDFQEILARLENPGDNEELPLLKILDGVGLEPCLLALGAVTEDGIGERDRISRLAATDFAEHILTYLNEDLPEDPRPSLGVQAARKYAEGQIEAQELAATHTEVETLVQEFRLVAHGAAYVAKNEQELKRAAVLAHYASAVEIAARPGKISVYIVALEAQQAAGFFDCQGLEEQWQFQRLREYLV